MSFERQQSLRRSIPHSLRPFYDLYQALKAIGKTFLLIALGIAAIFTAIQAIILPFQQTCKAFSGIFRVFDALFKRPLKRVQQHHLPQQQQPVQMQNPDHTVKKECKQG